MKKLTAAPQLGKVTSLVGESKQAPGLKTREGDILHKALGLTPGTQIHPMALGALAQYHPDPKVQKMASNALSKLDFQMKPPTP